MDVVFANLKGIINKFRLFILSIKKMAVFKVCIIILSILRAYFKENCLWKIISFGGAFLKLINSLFLTRTIFLLQK